MSALRALGPGHIPADAAFTRTACLAGRDLPQLSGRTNTRVDHAALRIDRRRNPSMEQRQGSGERNRPTHRLERIFMQVLVLLGESSPGSRQDSKPLAPMVGLGEPATGVDSFDLPSEIHSYVKACHQTFPFWPSGSAPLYTKRVRVRPIFTSDTLQE